MKIDIAPLKGSFMIISIIGFIISAVWLYDVNPTWGFTFCLIFAMMFIASIVSMTYAPVSGELHVDESRKKRKK